MLIDTDYAGTLPAFFQAIKRNRVAIGDITYVLATHYHPDHVGLISELMELGIKLLVMDFQKEFIHFPDPIFQRDTHLSYKPIREQNAVLISGENSRAFFSGLGIAGEVIPTVSHSRDGIAVILDDGCCFVGDLEPMEYIAAYEDNAALQADWERIMRHHPRVIYHAHANERYIVKKEIEK